MLAVLAALALGLSSGGVAQDPPPQTPPTQLSDVVVETRPLAEAVRGFVDEVTEPLPGYGPARWDSRICVKVAYLREDLARYMTRRVETIARRAGLRTGPAGCRPNVLIIAAADGGAMATAMVEARSSLFLTHVSGANRSPSALETFQTADDAVRWWHISLPVNAAGQAAVRLPGRPPAEGGETVASRLRTELRNDLQRVFIVVDFNAASGATIRQLSDYVAMAALAQVDPQADASGYDSILNLFAEGEAPPELTDWDMDYLRALYGARLDQRQPSAQLEAVARVMARGRAAAAER